MARASITWSDLRATVWALKSLRAVRGQLRHNRVDRVRLRTAPRLPATARRGVDAALRRRRHSCLERALILQSWYAGQGRPLEVVIGVTGPHEFAAHAWLDGETYQEQPFQEIMRLSPR